MKATLTYELPVEQHDFDCAIQGAELRYAMTEYAEQIRRWLKHGHEFKNADEAINAARQHFYDLLMESNINLYD